MATLVLGTVGRAFGGPLGGVIGAAVGEFVDRGLLGGGSRGGFERSDNMTVQSAAYGEAIPIVSGRVRAAGNLIWTSGIKETAGSGGGKRNGASTSPYSYTASFAVGLAAREIDGVGRIWADGRLIRSADGMFIAPTTMRLHRGTEAQTPDPLIAAAESIALAPAYRGLAYVVFEDLALGDFGNRIPNLTFEIIADDDIELDIGRSLAALAVADGRQIASVTGAFPGITGHFAGAAGSVADTLAGLMDIVGASISGGPSINIVGNASERFLIPDDDCQTHPPNNNRGPDRLNRLGGEGRTDAVEIGYFDSALEFQPGLQRVRRSIGGVMERRSAPLAMSADQAKSLALASLVRLQANRLWTVVRLPWRYLWLKAGDQVKLGDDPTTWRIKAARFEDFVVSLDLERVATTALAIVAGASGRAYSMVSSSAGPVTVYLLDIPILQGEQPSASRILVASASTSPGWRGDELEISVDNGASYVSAGRLQSAAAMGVATTCLPPGQTASWDRHSMVEVELISDDMWLEGRAEASVLAGANLALIGNEIVQFSSTELIAPRTFRLSGLLRGRRGTEAEVDGHGIGERFVLLDPSSILPIDIPTDCIGRELRFRVSSAGDVGVPPTMITYSGKSLKPLAPTGLQLSQKDGSVRAAWTRRSRDGFAWHDSVDAPLAEQQELYQLTFKVGGVICSQPTVATNEFAFLPELKIGGGSSAIISVAVSQVSDRVGLGEFVEAELLFSVAGEVQ